MALPLPGYQSMGQMIQNRLDQGLQNRLQQESLKNALLQNKFFEPIQAAEAASRQSYAKYKPAEILGTYLSSPNVQGLLSRNQLEQLAGQFTNLLMNPPELQGLSSENKLGILPPGINESTIPQSNAFVQPRFSSQQNIGGNNLVSGAAAVTPESGQNISQPGLAPATAGISGARLPGTQQITPIQATEAVGSYVKKLSEKEAEAVTKQWETMQDNAASQSEGAQESLNDLNQFYNAYQQLLPVERGFGLGSAPAISSNAQVADRASKNLMTARLKALQTGHITNTDFNIGEKLKAHRGMAPEAARQAVAFDTGVNLRTLERQDFNDEAQRSGLTPTQANRVWSKYIQERPFYSEKDKNLIEENLGSYGDYLDPQMLNEILTKKKKGPSKEYLELTKKSKKPGLSSSKSKYSDEDIKFTANKYGITVEEVKKRMGL